MQIQTDKVFSVLTVGGMAALIMAFSLLAAGCGGGEPEEETQTTYRPPPPPPLSPLEDLDIDPRVQFPETSEPTTRELAQAIADLASGLVSGDQRMLKEILSRDARAVLDQLDSTGAWDSATSDIEVVRVCSLEEDGSGDGCLLGLGVQDQRGAYLLAWGGERQGERWEFTARPVDRIEAAQVALLDGVGMPMPALPAPVELDIDPNAERKTPMKRFDDK